MSVCLFVTSRPLPWQEAELQKAMFVSLVKLLQLGFGEKKKNMIYDQFSITAKCVNPQFHLNALFLSLSTGVTAYFHDIS